MKVKDLIEKLQKFDPELPVFASTEDEELIKENVLFKILSIDNVTIVEGEPIREPETYKPSFKLGPSESSRKYVFIDVVAQF